MARDADDLAGIGHNSDTTGGELLQFLERIEQLQSEIKDIKEQEKEVFAEAKGRGFDTKTMRKILKMRKQTPDERAEEDAILDTYLTALGMI